MRSAEPIRWLACWLLSAVVLVQSLWLPFHLASERHLAAGEAPTIGFSVAATAPRGEEMRGDGDESPLGRLHFGLEHKSARDTRVDDEVALPLDCDSPCPPDPLAGLFDTSVAKLVLQPATSCVRSVRISPQPARAPPAA